MENGTTMPNVLFREIHKNGVLKKYMEKRTGFPRKAERVWAVFCVHDDTEAFLEFYTDQKAALTHKPHWFVSLHSALHISPSICGSSDEHEFAVTLPNQVVRLAAGSWDVMMEWVETIRNKLRELRVLAPKENVYSKMPEARQGLLPTRDPTSPLPQPPVGPRGVVPGVESPIRTHSSLSNSSSPPNTPQSPSENSQSNGIEAPRRRVDDNALLEFNNTSHSVIQGGNQPPEVSVISNLDSRELIPESSTLENEETSRSGASIVVVNSEEISSLPLVSEDEKTPILVRGPLPLPTLSATPPPANNVTVIEVPTTDTQHYERLFLPSSAANSSSEDSRSKLERVSSSGLIPRVPSRPKRDAHEVPRTREENLNGRAELAKLVSSPTTESQHTSVVRVKSFKEQKQQTSLVRVVPGSGVSVVAVETPSTSVSWNSANLTQDAVPPITVAVQPVPGNLEVKDIPLIGGHQRRRRRSSSSDVGQSAISTRSLAGADLIRTTPAEAPEPPITTVPLTLRETQVCQLQREMTHPGGVRLKLRRKDCLGAIALVDVSNSVWIAGWKQRDHPLLYNALHIGDQLLIVGEYPVHSSLEAQKLLKGPIAAMVEIVVRRLPLGKVLTLQRPRREGDVGLVPNASVPGEVTVEPGGIAAKAGLPLYAPSMDGLALTTWTLTEINGRPLNLFCKSSDVTMRLNSVGKELSILVQPTDFIKQLKKQLKGIRGYKDYLLH